MLFNSFQFLWLFPLVFVGYYGLSWLLGRDVQGKGSNRLLLLMSYGLYMQWNAVYGLVLLGVTLATYAGALAVERFPERKRVVAWMTIGLSLAPLLVFKYYDFVAENVNNWAGSACMPGLNWAIPIGISFYSFQAVGYLIDVYKQRIRAERNLGDYALFVAFFPQILSGPISRAADLLPQIKRPRRFCPSKAVQGLKWLLWGMFLKVVLADRLGLYVDSVYNNYLYQSGASCLVASVMYSLQIYGDFAGYSLMAIGVGRLMGFDLVNNFERPYWAASITEFWRRWHISLTRWLTTYVYIGLGGNRCSRMRQYANIMATFLVSGLWHGANWTFVAWGAMHGLLQCLEKALGLDPKGTLSQTPWLKRLRPFRVVLTFGLVNMAWILFRLPSVEVAGRVLGKIVRWEGEGVFLPSNSAIVFMALAILIVLAKEACEELAPAVQVFNHRNRVVRWTGYVCVVTLIMLCGVFDAGQFIYVKF